MNADPLYWIPDIVVHNNLEPGPSTVTLRNVRAGRMTVQGDVVLSNVDLDEMELTCFSTLDASHVTVESIVTRPAAMGTIGPQAFTDSILAVSRWPPATAPALCPLPRPTVTNSIVPDDRGEPGTFVADPLFVPGPAGEHYLSSVAAGQSADSPAIDRGSRDVIAAGLAARTTRTDGVPDAGVVDLGYHAPSNVLMPELYVPTIYRGTTPTTLAVHATSALPWTDAPGTASDPALRLLFYSIEPWLNSIDVTLDRSADAPKLGWHGRR